MSTVRALFPGAMGPEGFISCFDHLIPEARLRRLLILKGGPGVGKSTFMRRIHALLSSQDEETTLYFCSGDPDSLDAVAAPQAGILILDGTAPHIVDPIIPGARDSLINLGVCLDEAAMRPRLPHIRACMADHAACSQRARAYMRSAWALRQDSASAIAACTDEAHRTRMQSALIAAVLQAEGEKSSTPSVRPVITDALTPKGELCLLTDSAQRRVIRLGRHFAMDLTPVLRALSCAAQAAGYDVEEHLSPMSPGSLLHLTIPALHTLVTTNETLACEQTFDFAACVPAARLLRRECALAQSRADVARHMQRAVGAMTQAKQLHDELETFYVPNMDFAKWQILLEETIDSLKEDCHT
ncbi:MAG: hypothetical protein ACI4MM_12110 [Candidatus Ventricola sp.]